MSTVREMIRRSLQLIGVVGQGEELESVEANDALSALNDLIASLSIEGAVIYEETRESFTLIGGKAEYTIGSGGDFDTARPIRILSAFTVQGGISYSIDIQDQLYYADVAQKGLATDFPSVLYYDADYPLGNILLYPVPTGAYDLHLYSEKPLSSLATLDTVLSYPPGYERMLRYNLACEVAPEYGISPLPKVQEVANRSLRSVKNANRMNDDNKAQVDDALVRMNFSSYNIYGDVY